MDFHISDMWRYNLFIYCQYCTHFLLHFGLGLGLAFGLVLHEKTPK